MLQIILVETYIYTNDQHNNKKKIVILLTSIIAERIVLLKQQVIIESNKIIFLSSGKLIKLSCTVSMTLEFFYCHYSLV